MIKYASKPHCVSVRKAAKSSRYEPRTSTSLLPGLLLMLAKFYFSRGAYTLSYTINKNTSSALVVPSQSPVYHLLKHASKHHCVSVRKAPRAHSATSTSQNPGLGLPFPGFKSRVLGFRERTVRPPHLHLPASGFRVLRSRFRVSHFGFRVSGFGFAMWGLELGVSTVRGLIFRV